MLIVATDASVRHVEGYGSWAAVLCHEDGSVRRLRGRLGAADSCHAELLAVYRALSATRRGCAVELIVDNNRVVAWLLGVRPPARLARLVRTVRRMIARRGGVVRWTPAHRNEEDPLHREADQLARAAANNFRSI